MASGWGDGFRAWGEGRDLTVEGDVVIDGGDLTLGDGTGSVTQIYKKSDAGTTRVEFWKGTTLTNDAKSFLHDTDETFKVQARIAGAWTTIADIANAGGLTLPTAVTMSSTLAVTGAFDANGAVTLGGNVDVDSASPTLTVGTSGGSPTVVLAKATDGVTQLVFQQTVGISGGKRFVHGSGENMTWDRFDGAVWESTFEVPNSGAALCNVAFTLVGTGANLTVQGTGTSSFAGAVEIDGALDHDGTTVGLYGKAPVVQAAAIAALVDNMGAAAPDGTLADVPSAAGDAGGIGTVSAAANVATVASVNAMRDVIENNLADLRAHVNSLAAAVRGIGIVAT